MTAARVRAMQSQPPVPGLSLVRVTIATVSPLTVVLPGGATLPGVEVPGLTYIVDASAWALVQEPLVGPVFPTA